MITSNAELDTENRRDSSRNAKIDELKQLKEELLQDNNKKDDKPLTKKRKK